jgi:hypothetical protein
MMNFHDQSDEEDNTYGPPGAKEQDEPGAQLDLSQTLATSHCKDFYNFDVIRPLRVSLEAVVIAPRSVFTLWAKREISADIFRVSLMMLL